MTKKITNSLFLLTILSIFIVSCKQGTDTKPETTTGTGASHGKEIFKSQDADFVVDTVASNVQIPFGIDFLPDGRMIFTERSKKTGNISLLDTATGKITVLGNTPTVDNDGQGGMLDVLVHPDYAKNGWIYFDYSVRKPDSTTSLIVERGKIENNAITQVQRIFEGFPYFKSSNHYGSRLLIRDGYLFITMGERASAPDSAQKLSTTLGKVLRVKEDGSIPEDNPFVKVKGARPEIWSYGHRNLQGLAFQPGTGWLWESEHGPQGGDEVNIIKPGKNYGWPIITFGEKYGGGKWGAGITMKEGMEQPAYFYRPSIGPGGMTFYDGDKFPKWKGSLFIGSLAYQHLNRLIIRQDTIVKEERLLTRPNWRVRVVKQGPDGYIYFGVDNGMILRLRPVNDEENKK
ncbi:MAG: PQQ-dependent sugar dehydrogenase [Chitinophagaceae bacterium]